jgi:septum formation protein
METTKILLASGSPRRQEMLAWTGWDYRVQAADIDETRQPGEEPLAFVQRLAREKAAAALRFAQPGELILACDTIVTMNGDLYEKPADAQDARAMLQALRGREHYVGTAISLLAADSSQCESDVCLTPVRMREYSDTEIDTYIASGDPFDKAGAYGIQHRGFHPSENFRSCFASVMGLPLCHVVRAVRKFGLPAAQETPTNCQLNLSYVCPVYRDIL